ncbi:hypothetical protein V5799_024913 [Amblyomma americanum]|uniref:Uncharacterized protein n=1 Tax=Amblyomma americanum TaxID=6943 RepID=A0AAQ4EB35_AMBAM
MDRGMECVDTPLGQSVVTAHDELEPQPGRSKALGAILTQYSIASQANLTCHGSLCRVPLKATLVHGCHNVLIHPNYLCGLPRVSSCWQIGLKSWFTQALVLLFLCFSGHARSLQSQRSDSLRGLMQSGKGRLSRLPQDSQPGQYVSQQGVAQSARESCAHELMAGPPFLDEASRDPLTNVSSEGGYRKLGSRDQN